MVAAVRDPRSIGVRAYVDRLSAALAPLGVDYKPTWRPPRNVDCHFHLANSTRTVIPHAALRQRQFLLTVHDVLPRSRALRPVHRGLLLPLCLRRASTVVVHSRHAAELLMDVAGIDARRVQIVPHPAPALARDPAAARTALRIAIDGPPLFVLPGTLKAAKLVHETLVAAARLLALGRARLLLAGHIADENLAREALAQGVIVLRDPDRITYENAIVAADAVLCLRGDTVGESNGPLLDAIGAGRPSLVTAVGSGPEIAGDSARVVGPTLAEIKAGITALLAEDERSWRARAARERAAELSWEAAARVHLKLLSEVRDA